MPLPMRAFFASALLALGLSLVPGPAAATTVERVVSPGGIEAWLVRETSAPLIAVEFAFRGGNSQEPPGKEGVGTLVAVMLDEGAGEYDSRAFQERQRDLAVQLSFSASRDWFSGAFRTLSVNRDAAFDLLRLALNEPHFTAPDLERMRAAIGAQLRREATEPNAIASRAFGATAFPGHPYGRPGRGTLASVATITRDDLAAYHRRIFARDGLKIAVVGDIDATTLGALLDRTFGTLPARAELTPVPAVMPVGLGARRIVELDTPQTIIQFGTNGLRLRDPDFFPALVVNHVLGGGSFTSRLWQEIRERRGLTYGVNTTLLNYQNANLFAGSMSTRNDAAAEALATIEAELRRMAEEGPTEAELIAAKSYLTGSYLLRFDTSPRIASQLVAIQMDELGIDWINRRNSVIEAVTIEDARRAARRLLSQDFLFTLVGRPQGVTERRPGG
jgi:zinc protease